MSSRGSTKVNSPGKNNVADKTKRSANVSIAASSSARPEVNTRHQNERQVSQGAKNAIKNL
jgi:hypothetical protein